MTQLPTVSLLCSRTVPLSGNSHLTRRCQVGQFGTVSHFRIPKEMLLHIGPHWRYDQNCICELFMRPFLRKECDLWTVYTFFLFHEWRISHIHTLSKFAGEEDRTRFKANEIKCIKKERLYLLSSIYSSLAFAQHKLNCHFFSILVSTRLPC